MHNLTLKQKMRLVEILQCYIRTWEREVERAKEERWTTVEYHANLNIADAREILAEMGES